MSLLIVSGPPGAGKSSVATLLADHYDPSFLVAGDDFFAFAHSGAIQPWLPEAHRQNTVIIEAAARATGHIATAFDTIYDGVVGPWFVDTFATGLGLDAFDYVVLLPAVELLVERVAAREGHGFASEAATRKMHREFDEAEVAAHHVIRPGRHESAADVAAEVLHYRQAGLLRYEPALATGA